jgi:enolase-phosphatase E1
VIKAILVDIEGTTTDIAFVKEVLFPLARREMARFIADEGAAFVEPLARLRAQAGGEGLVRFLQQMIDDDSKDTDLKLLQGALWRRAYAEGLRAHVYPDVAPALSRWRAQGLRLAVFSSGSVEAQRLLFAHSIAGDLTAHFDAWFDTTSGHKRDPESYRRIAGALELAPEEVLFLSDVSAELDAAETAGMKALLVCRPGATAASRLSVTSFEAVVLV